MIRASFVPAAAFVALACASCAQGSPSNSVLQSTDLSPPHDAQFDANNILSDGALADASSLPGDAVQKLLAKTPYGRGSFLETYQSNGFVASDAIQRTAARYQINPLVLLARLEVDGGLVGEGVYPTPPSRVEYVFNCGCAASGACDPAYAGLDKQLDCLGSTIRTTLDAITSTGATPGGWAPTQAKTTLDGQSVTPGSNATAALYDYEPVVAVGKGGGNWVFWSVFSNYAAALDYTSPIGPPAGAGWIGDACGASTDCGYTGSVCDTTKPGGACTFDCTHTPCPTFTGKAQTFCADVGGTGSCLQVCQPDVSASCRSGYQCSTSSRLGDTGPDQQFVCQAGQ